LQSFDLDFAGHLFTFYRGITKVIEIILNQSVQSVELETRPTSNLDDTKKRIVTKPIKKLKNRISVIEVSPVQPSSRATTIT